MQFIIFIYFIQIKKIKSSNSAPSQFYGSNCCVENDRSWHLTNKVHTWFTYFHFFNLKFLESCLTPIFNLQSNDWLRIKIFQRIQKNHSGEKLSSETKRTYFFDNFTSFRFHSSPNLLSSVLFINLGILHDKLLQINEKLSTMLLVF